MGIDESFNFRRVSGTVTTSGIVARDVLAGLGAQGYDALVNLLPDSSEHAVAGEAAIVGDQGVGYVHIPVDFAAPTSAQLDEFIAAMDARPGQTIHVHCAANYRVSAFYGLYALSKGWWSVEEADEHISSLWSPAADPVWGDFVASERARLAP